MARLYLLRHGEAERIADSDAERPLTDRGHLQAQRAAAQINPIDCLLLHSPLRRAVETAEVLSRHIKPVGQRVEPLLKPESSFGHLASFVSELETQIGDQGAVILVSHNPLVSQLLAMLTGHDAHEVSIPTGGLVLLKGRPWMTGCMKQRWLT